MTCESNVLTIHLRSLDDSSGNPGNHLAALTVVYDIHKISQDCMQNIFPYPNIHICIYTYHIWTLLQASSTKCWLESLIQQLKWTGTKSWSGDFAEIMDMTDTWMVILGISFSDLNHRFNRSFSCWQDRGTCLHSIRSAFLKSLFLRSSQFGVIAEPYPHESTAITPKWLKKLFYWWKHPPK